MRAGQFHRRARRRSSPCVSMRTRRALRREKLHERSDARVCASIECGSSAAVPADAPLRQSSNTVDRRRPPRQRCSVTVCSVHASVSRTSERHSARRCTCSDLPKPASAVRSGGCSAFQGIFAAFTPSRFQVRVGSSLIERTDCFDCSILLAPFTRSADAALHLQADEVVHFHGVFHGQFACETLSAKPLTISARASSSLMPRLIR